MNNNNLTPIDSGFATYDATFNRYYLTLGGYQALTGIDLTTYPNLNVSPTQILNAASDTLYDILIGYGKRASTAIRTCRLDSSSNERLTGLAVEDITIDGHLASETTWLRNSQTQAA